MVRHAGDLGINTREESHDDRLDVTYRLRRMRRIEIGVAKQYTNVSYGSEPQACFIPGHGWIGKTLFDSVGTNTSYLITHTITIHGYQSILPPPKINTIASIHSIRNQNPKLRLKFTSCNSASTLRVPLRAQISVFVVGSRLDIRRINCPPTSFWVRGSSTKLRNNL
jgi:hypothetical protein